jgi:hypothetical protein
MAATETRKTVAAGTNVEAVIVGDVLTITVKLNQENGESKSGKSIVVGSTHGTVRLNALGRPDLMLGLNVNVSKK